jgi:predicted DNA-binding protein (UPF0251 family)
MANGLLQEVKDLAIVRVLALMAQKRMSVSKACSLVGVSVSTFTERIEANQELVTDFIQEQRAKFQVLYTDIIAARELIVHDLIKAAEDSETSIKDRLAIDLRLREMQESLEQELALVRDEPDVPLPALPSSAESFVETMRGPVLRRGTGKATMRETTIEFEVDTGPQEDAVEGKINP